MLGRAFTLVEILSVIVILGVLAAIVVPAFAGAADDARVGAFVSTMRTHAKTIDVHTVRTGSYPADSSSGDLPPELAPTVDPADWESGTPLGGVWDFEFNDHGLTAAIGVHFNSGPGPGDAVMHRVDATFDDTDLSAGAFRKLAGDRYYLVLAE